MALIYDSSHSGQEIDAAVDAVQTTIPSQLAQIGSKTDQLEAWKADKTELDSLKYTDSADTLSFTRIYPYAVDEENMVYIAKTGTFYSLYYRQCTAGEIFHFTAENNEAKAFIITFCTQIPAENVAIQSIPYSQITTKVDTYITAPINGYLVFYKYRTYFNESPSYTRVYNAVQRIGKIEADVASNTAAIATNAAAIEASAEDIAGLQSDMAAVGDMSGISPYPTPTSIADFTRALKDGSGSYGFSATGVWSAYNGTRTAFIVPIPNPSAKYTIIKNGVATVAINAVTSAIFDYIDGTGTDTGFLMNLASESVSTTDLVIEAGTLPSVTEYLAVSVTKTNRELVTISTSDSTLVARLEALEERIDAKSFKVACIGDSLTAGAGSSDTTNLSTVIAKMESLGFSGFDTSGASYPNCLDHILDTVAEHTVYQMGVGGETINTIGARIGANEAYIQAGDGITIPADATTVKVGETTNDNSLALLSGWDRDNTIQRIVTPLLQSTGTRVNPCYVEGVECTMTYSSGSYYLKRNAAGSAMTIKGDTPVVMSGAYTMRDADISVIWAMQNGSISDSASGGYSDVDELMEKMDRIVQSLPTSKYVIVSLHTYPYTDTANKREEMRRRLSSKYGAKFIDWHKYSVLYALSEYGITATSEDEARMAAGNIPTSLLYDSIHLNAAGYLIVAHRIYLRMKELGYFTKI